jgi:Uma2 family endonuclease
MASTSLTRGFRFTVPDLDLFPDIPGVRYEIIEGELFVSGTGWKSSDLEELPDIEGVRYEIIAGELYVSRAPGARHQYTCGALASTLHVWSTQTGLGRTFPGPGLVFADDDDVIPDLVWVRRERVASILDRAGHFREAPELVVEVLSPGGPNEFRDRTAKLELYRRRGVLEYWVVDPRKELLEIYRVVGTELKQAATLSGKADLISPLLPGFTCPLASLWLPEVEPTGS